MYLYLCVCVSLYIGDGGEWIGLFSRDDYCYYVLCIEVECGRVEKRRLQVYEVCIFDLYFT